MTTEFVVEAIALPSTTAHLPRLTAPPYGSTRPRLRRRALTSARDVQTAVRVAQSTIVLRTRRSEPYHDLLLYQLNLGFVIGGNS